MLVMKWASEFRGKLKFIRLLQSFVLTRDYIFYFLFYIYQYSPVQPVVNLSQNKKGSNTIWNFERHSVDLRGCYCTLIDDDTVISWIYVQYKDYSNLAINSMKVQDKRLYCRVAPPYPEITISQYHSIKSTLLILLCLQYFCQPYLWHCTIHTWSN